MTVSRLRLRLLWLTLFAFGVQIVVADFHHHLTHISGIYAQAVTATMCQPSPDHPCGPIKKDHDGCALCWAVSIVATSLTPVLFDVPPPSIVAGDQLMVTDPRKITVLRLADARARGPPSNHLG